MLKRENYSEARKKKEKKTNTNPRPLGHLGLPQMRWWNWTIFCLNNQKKKKKHEGWLSQTVRLTFEFTIFYPCKFKGLTFSLLQEIQPNFVRNEVAVK